MTWDLSVNVGSSEVDQFIYNTVNASIGYDTPTSFNPGIYEQTDTNVNFDITYPCATHESRRGPRVAQRAVPYRRRGRSVLDDRPLRRPGIRLRLERFNGYRPENSGTWDRANVAIYGDLEIDAPTTGDLHRRAAGRGLRRFRQHDQREGLRPAAGVRCRVVRAAASTGFRAPTPGQQNAFNVTTAFDPETGGLSNSGTVPSTSLPAALRGGEDLQPEEAVNISPAWSSTGASSH